MELRASRRANCERRAGRSEEMSKFSPFSPSLEKKKVALIAVTVVAALASLLFPHLSFINRLQDKEVIARAAASAALL